MTQELPEGTVTILFTDVEGSTALALDQGDESAHGLLRSYRDLVRQQVKLHSGHEVKTMGDGFMVAFASARRAVNCAVDIQRSVDRGRLGPVGQELKVRIGLHSGEAIQEEADLFGSAVNAAARITAKAGGGQILVSDTTRSLLPSAKDVVFADRGRFRLKGFADRWHLHEVVWRQEGAPSGAPAMPEQTPFVGRVAEREQLRSLLDQAANGRGSFIIIGGEPGLGKTRLAEELISEARKRGITALLGRCYEGEGRPPYIPLVEMLESAARMYPLEALRDMLGDSAAEVAKLLPELRRLFPDIPSSPELPPEQERRYLFNGMRDFLARAANVQALMLVFDDLHWADESTMLLVRHIGQQLSGLPILMVGTYRDVELDLRGPLGQALEEMLRQRLAHNLILKRLPVSAVSAMLAALGGREPPEPLVRSIYGKTEGNPFFVEEVFKHLAEEGLLLDADGRWRTDLAVSELNVPPGVRLVVGRRLARVTESCRRTLITAAVVGRSFSYELLEAIGELEADPLLDAIDEAERAHLITASSENGQDRFAFSHELVRQTLLGDISRPRRRRLHSRVAEAMERVYASSAREHAADLAYHFHQAGSAIDSAKTLHYLTLAGDEALSAAALEDAARLYDTALSVQASEEEALRPALLFKRGLALRSLGRWDEAVADWRKALATYEARGDAEAVGRISSDVTIQLGWGGRLMEALEISRRGLTALGEQMTRDRCRLLSSGGIILSMAGSYDSGHDMILGALETAEEIGDRQLLGYALTSKANHHFMFMQIHEQAASAERGAELLRESGDLWYLADALWLAQWAYLYLGRLPEVERLSAELEPLAGRLGHMGALLAVRRICASRDLMLTANLDRFEESARADLELCLSTGMPWSSRSHTCLGMAHLWRGRWEEAVESFRLGAQLEPPGMFAGEEWGSLLLGTAYMGDREAALDILSQKEGGLPKPGRVNTIGAWVLLLKAAEALAVLGEQEEAGRLYPLVLEAMESGYVMRDPGERLLRTVAGMAAAASKRWPEAEEHFQAALRQADELPHLLEQPEVRRWYASMLLERDAPGDRERARALLLEASEAYRLVGMPRHEQVARSLLEEA